MNQLIQMYVLIFFIASKTNKNIEINFLLLLINLGKCIMYLIQLVNNRHRYGKYF